MRSIVATVVFAGVAFVAACGDSGTGPEETVTVQTAPTEQLATLIQEAPSEFTWGNFNTSMVFRSSDTIPEPMESELCAVAIEAGDVTGQVCSEQVTLTVQQLESGVTSEELLTDPSTDWIPGETWFPSDTWFPSEAFFPSDAFQPTAQAVAQGVLSAYTPGSGTSVNAVAVYASPVSGYALPTNVRPFALILEQE